MCIYFTCTKRQSMFSDIFLQGLHFYSCRSIIKQQRIGCKLCIYKFYGKMKSKEATFFTSLSLSAFHHAMVCANYWNRIWNFTGYPVSIYTCSPQLASVHIACTLRGIAWSISRSSTLCLYPCIT